MEGHLHFQGKQAHTVGRHIIGFAFLDSPISAETIRDDGSRPAFDGTFDASVSAGV